MKVRIVHTLERTLELEVDAADEQQAIAAALQQAADIQPADWHYTWEPTATTGDVVR